MAKDYNYFDAAPNKAPDKTVKMSKWGNSQGIRFSKDDLNKAGFLMEDSLNMYVENNKIILEKPKKHQSLAERFADYNGDYNPAEWETGDSIGTELL